MVMSQERCNAREESSEKTRSPQLGRYPMRWFKTAARKDREVRGETEYREPSKKEKPTRWSMGVLNVPDSRDVPGSVFLLDAHREGPSGPQNTPGGSSSSQLPTPHEDRLLQEKKRTPDGKIILNPQPDDTDRDPLNLPKWKKNMALFSLGIYCMVGGGMTPILAAGFNDVSSTFNVTVSQVALTTGLYMMGLGVGSVIASPMSLLFGKRFIYLCSVVTFIITSCWCAASPSFLSLLVARTFQGLSVSPVECLPSATITEIFFLHERASKVGIYALMLVGGKNLVPVAGAAIVQFLGWRWIFWIVAILLVFCGALLFFFVPETFCDRRDAVTRKLSKSPGSSTYEKKDTDNSGAQTELPIRPTLANTSKDYHVESALKAQQNNLDHDSINITASNKNDDSISVNETTSSLKHNWGEQITPLKTAPLTPNLHNHNSPWYLAIQDSNSDYIEAGRKITEVKHDVVDQREKSTRKGLCEQLKPYRGRMSSESWLEVAFRPFRLFAYPAILWSSAVYSCSVGWLIILSESVSSLFSSQKTYGFSPLSTGMIYLSPLIGGILGTAIAGKISDLIIKYISRHNGGLYEPEFRLIMAAPVAVTTAIGLMGIGWSVEVHDAWIIPVIFFGIISFGCSLGVTTSIAFCVDSYRQFAVEALVTLNFSKNIFHGLAFSFFFTKWLQHDGPKEVFIWLGIIQLILMAFTIPMYIFGKKARMWTVRAKL